MNKIKILKTVMITTVTTSNFNIESKICRLRCGCYCKLFKDNPDNEDDSPNKDPNNKENNKEKDDKYTILCKRIDRPITSKNGKKYNIGEDFSGSFHTISGTGKDFYWVIKYKSGEIKISRYIKDATGRTDYYTTFKDKNNNILEIIIRENHYLYTLKMNKDKLEVITHEWAISSPEPNNNYNEPTQEKLDSWKLIFDESDKKLTELKTENIGL